MRNIEYGIPSIKNDSDLMRGLVLKSVDKMTRVDDAHTQYIKLVMDCVEKWGRSPIFAGSFIPTIHQYIQMKFIKIFNECYGFENCVIGLTERGRLAMKRYLGNLERVI